MNLHKLTAVAMLLTLAGCNQSADTAKPMEQETAPMPEAQTSAPPTPSLAGMLAGGSRAAEDRARDQNRKPADVVDYLGIEPGMSVIDIIAAGGYYTEVLSLAVGPDGHVVAQNPAMVLQFNDGANDKALAARLAGDRLPNVRRMDAELTDLASVSGTFDAGITALNFHDIYNNYGEAGATGAMTAIYSLLKPGGVFGVIDHDGAEGNDNVALHRVRKADAVRIAEAAGFVVEGDSGILHMHDDDMSRQVFDEAVRGKTTRFLLKLRKPASM